MERQPHTVDAKLIPIGNSKGIRIPKAIILKYDLKDSVLLEETDRGLLLRTKEEKKLSWDETYRTMAEEKENWEDFDATLLYGREEDDLGY